MPIPAATLCATAYNAVAADSCIGGRLIDPLTLIVAPATVGCNAPSAVSTRAFSETTLTRTSTVICAAAGTTFSVVPAVAIVGVTVVPISG